MIELLYKKKIIRDFLSLFTENHWKQLISSLVEFGIINLKKQHKITSLTAEEIIQIVENLKQGENLIEIKPKMTINKILNKNASQKGANTSESRSRSKSKKSDQKFHKNSAKKSATISKSKSPNINIRSNSNKKISANRENLSDKSKDGLVFQYDSMNKKDVKITNHKSSYKSNDGNDKNFSLPIRKEISSSLLSGRAVKNNLNEQAINDTKNQFPIKKVANININNNNNKNYTTELETDAIHATNNIKKYNTHTYNSNNHHSAQNSNTKANTSNIANKSYLNLTTDQRVNTSIHNLEEKERRISTSKVITDSKKKNTKQILEQINLNKLKEKMKNPDMNKSNEDETNAKTPNLSKKFSKVESKIKSEIEKDKKIFNLIKNSNEAGNLPRDEMKENSNLERVTNSNARGLKMVGNTNNSPDKYQDSNSPFNIKNAQAHNTMKTIKANQNQNIMDRKESDKTNAAAVISLENRLNGLTQKIADVEKNSKQSDLNLNSQLTNKINYNYTNNNNYKDSNSYNSYHAYNQYNPQIDSSYDKYSSSPMIINNTHISSDNHTNQYLQNPQSQNKNIKFDTESRQQNAMKNQANDSDYYLYKNDTSRNEEDNYNDDKYDIDLNKYKYLNHNNYKHDDTHNYNNDDEDDNAIDIDDNLHDDYEY